MDAARSQSQSGGAEPAPAPAIDVDPQLEARFLRWSTGSGAAAAALGLLVLMGWALNVGMLKSPLHQLAMKPNTAVCLVAGGVAVTLLRREAPRRWRAVRGLLALLVGVIALLTLAEYLLRLDLQIDQILVRDGEGFYTPPGRMAMPSAACLLLLSGAILGIDWETRSRNRPSQWMALGALVVVTLAIADYAVDLQPGVTSIAIHTIPGLALLATGVLMARPRDSVMRTIASPYSGGKVARRMLPLGFVIPITMGVLHLLGERGGLLGLEWDFAWMTVGTVVLTVGAVWWHAARLNDAEERSEGERLAAAQRLAEQRSYARTLLEASLDPLVTISADGRIMDVNEATERASGVERERLIGSDFCEYFTEPARARQGYQEAFEKGTVRDYPLAIRHVSGEIMYVLYNANVYRNEAGKVAGVFAAARDITRSQKAENELRRVDRALRTIRVCNQAIVHSTDEATLNAEICRAIAEEGRYRMAWVGYAEEDPGKTVRPVAHGGIVLDYLESVAVSWADSERGHSPTGTAVREGRPMVCRDFQAAALSPWRESAARCGYACSLAVPLMRDGKAFGVLSIYASDPEAFDEEETRLLTALADDLAYGICSLRARREREEAQQEILRLNQTLEERVRERTAEVEALNRRLDRQVLDLKSVNTELESFTYSVSHDLRSPLRHIAGFSELLREECGAELSADAAHYLEEICDGTRRMGELVDDLLNLARVGRQELSVQVAGLRGVVDSVVQALAGENPQRTLEWKIGELPFVECDPGLMRQVFVNLLSNAVKFTRPREHAVIEVGVSSDVAGPVVFVRDNGVGFSPKYAGKLFGVFQRLHRSEDFEGTGVGLATVQRIIQKHGGRVWAEAKLDQGAAFYFSLPAAREERAPAEDQEVLCAK